MSKPSAWLTSAGELSEILVERGEVVAASPIGALIRSMDEPTGVMILNDAPPSLVESNALSCEQRDLNSAQVPDAYTIHPLDSPEKLMCVMFPAGGSAAGAAAVIAFPVSDTTDIRFWATTTMSACEPTTTDGPACIEPLFSSRRLSGTQEAPPSDV